VQWAAIEIIRQVPGKSPAFGKRHAFQIEIA
jgi:hypothetical protein